MQAKLCPPKIYMLKSSESQYPPVISECDWGNKALTNLIELKLGL